MAGSNFFLVEPRTERKRAGSGPPALVSGPQMGDRDVFFLRLPGRPRRRGRVARVRPPRVLFLSDVSRREVSTFPGGRRRASRRRRRAQAQRRDPLWAVALGGTRKVGYPYTLGIAQGGV